jgi:hypothetical protein
LLIACRTFQELVLSQRVLVFTAKEAFFYCPEGIQAESFYRGDDESKAFPLFRPEDIGLCGLLYRTVETNSMLNILDLVDEHRTTYLSLVNTYMKRTLTHDKDGFNALFGITTAASQFLGRFYWGLPIKLLARGLLLRLENSNGSALQKPGFPSWSWLGWSFGSLVPSTTRVYVSFLGAHNLCR